MGWCFVKQPNGRLARFSEVVDDFTDYNLTEQEAIDLCIKEYSLGSGSAEEKVKRGSMDAPIWPSWIFECKGDGLDRFREAIEIIRRNHGDKHAKGRERDLSQAVGGGADG